MKQILYEAHFYSQFSSKNWLIVWAMFCVVFQWQPERRRPTKWWMRAAEDYLALVVLARPELAAAEAVFRNCRPTSMSTPRTCKPKPPSTSWTRSVADSIFQFSWNPSESTECTIRNSQSDRLTVYGLKYRCVWNSGQCQQIIWELLGLDERLASPVSLDSSIPSLNI